MGRDMRTRPPTSWAEAESKESCWDSANRRPTLLLLFILYGIDFESSWSYTKCIVPVVNRFYRITGPAL